MLEKRKKKSLGFHSTLLEETQRAKCVQRGSEVSLSLQQLSCLRLSLSPSFLATRDKRVATRLRRPHGKKFAESLICLWISSEKRNNRPHGARDVSLSYREAMRPSILFLFYLLCVEELSLEKRRKRIDAKASRKREKERREEKTGAGWKALEMPGLRAGEDERRREGQAQQRRRERKGQETVRRIRLFVSAALLSLEKR